MRFLQKKINGIIKRIRCYRYGMFYLRNAAFTIPSILKINGYNKSLRFIDTKDGSFVSEFTEICLNDCYRLGDLKKLLPKVQTIVDVGANQGLFLIAARQIFPEARIIAYEPNGSLEAGLKHNGEQLKAMIYMEAVMKTDCMVNLELTDSDLATSAHASPDGTVPGIAFRQVVERAGEIDILKMDCEGAEWDLLKDADVWSNIKALTMEYHLWTRPGLKFEKILQLLNRIGFEILHHQPISADQGLVMAVNRKSLLPA